MSMTAGRLSAMDSLNRGITILGSNWRLVPLRWGLMLIPTLFGLLAAVLPLLVTGRDLLTRIPQDPLAVQGWITEVIEKVGASPKPLALALAGSAALLLLSLIAWAYIEAGTYGILYSADRQAPAKAQRGAWFHTLSLRDFLGWGGRYLWRYLGLVLLWMGLLLVACLLIGALIGLAAAAGARWGTTAGIGLGCGGALPFGFVVIVLVCTFGLAMADQVREGSGPLRGFRVALRVFSRRLGAVLLLYVLWVVALIALTVLFALPSLALGAIFDRGSQAALTSSVLIQLVQSFVSQFLHLGLAASLVALVRSELLVLSSERAATDSPELIADPLAGESAT